MVARLKYLCITSHQNGRYFKAGMIYMLTVAPAGDYAAMFEIFAGEKYSSTENFGVVDLDGTWYPLNGDIGWDDWRFSAIRLRQGATLKPDFDIVNIGLLFPQDDPTEIVYATDVASHNFCLVQGVTWNPHIHFIQSEDNIPIFKLDYRITPITAVGQEPGAFTTIQTLDEAVVPYVSGDISQIIEFPLIDVWDETNDDPGLAPTLDFRLYRDDNVVTGEVLLKNFDIHVPFDAPLGSGQKFIK